MFGISVSEMVVIFIVALLVLGPERLPRAVRTLGFLTGKAVAVLNRLRFELAQELHQYDLKKAQQDSHAKEKDNCRVCKEISHAYKGDSHVCGRNLEEAQNDELVDGVSRAKDKR